MNVVIIHGSSSKDRENIKKYGLPPQNERHWLPWIKYELEKKNIQTFTPLMPKNWKEEYEDWKREFEKNEINKDSILVGHSSGADFLVRWLGETGRNVKKLILVAPGKLYTNYSVSFTKFCDFKIDSKIKNNIGEIIIFISNNDLEVIFKSAKLYEKKLNAKLIELKGRGHFTEKGMGTKEFPELLEKILE
ncbi:alpha/beta hydrolase [Candidatus Pacearchaeota archaeon]|nr:alpha/beta hydrolase [Candidatus Pacearchaeota archaeon]